MWSARRWCCVVPLILEILDCVLLKPYLGSPGCSRLLRLCKENVTSCSKHAAIPAAPPANTPSPPLSSAKASSLVRGEVPAPSWTHRPMIGHGKEKVQKMHEQFLDVYIKYTDEDKITLEGPPQDVDVVRKSLEVEAKGLVNTMAVQEIRSQGREQNSVEDGENNINGTAEEKHVTCVAGTPENCEGAKEALWLKEVVKSSQQSTTVNELHPGLVEKGSGGASWDILWYKIDMGNF